MLYQCELKSNGVIHERFFREGKSAYEVKQGLKLFQWPTAPKGAEWDVFLPESDEENY